MIGLVLLYVGAVLFVNGIWLLGHVRDREVAILNVFTGFVGVLVAIFAVAQGAARDDVASIQLASYVLLFAFTYLWVAYNQYVPGTDGRGLGWYSLFVAITAIPVAVITLAGAGGDAFLIWLGLDWIFWGFLWFLYFLLLGLQRPIGRLAGIVTIIAGVVTAWIPGFLFINEYL